MKRMYIIILTSLCSAAFGMHEEKTLADLHRELREVKADVEGIRIQLQELNTTLKLLTQPGNTSKATSMPKGDIPHDPSIKDGIGILEKNNPELLVLAIVIDGLIEQRLNDKFKN